MIELKNVSHITPENKTLISGISWKIKKGENWVLFGKNGSGKTKLLEIITGYLYPTTGEVNRFGRPSLGSDIRELRKRIGYVSTFLKDMIYPGEKVEDVICTGYDASTGLFYEPEKHQRDYAVSMLENIGMGNRRDDDFGILSDGEKQKILMLRAFVGRPELLIFDEPARGLDISSREDMLDSMKALCSGEVTSVYVTHNTDEIISIFKKIFIIDKGRAFFQGNIEDGMSTGRLSGLFGRKIEPHLLNGRYYTVVS